MKKKENKDPLHIDNIIAFCKKEGMEGMEEKIQELMWAEKELKKLKAENIITFEELVKLPEGYKYISRCKKDDEEFLIDVEEMSELEINEKEITWSQSSGDPTIKKGTGEIKNKPHCSDGSYTFTLYHIKNNKNGIKK